MIYLYENTWMMPNKEKQNVFTNQILIHTFPTIAYLMNMCYMIITDIVVNSNGM